MFSVLSLIVCAFGVRVVSCYAHYQEEIPNGDRVPSPCGGVWIGVGHTHQSGAGARNPFGRDFAENDHVSIV